MSSWRESVNVLLWFLSELGRRKALSLCCELWGGERSSLIKCKEKGVFCLREPVVALISKTPCFLISGLSLDPGPGNEIKDFFLKGKCLRWFSVNSCCTSSICIWKGNRGWMAKLCFVGWKGLGLSLPPFCNVSSFKGRVWFLRTQIRGSEYRTHKGKQSGKSPSHPILKVCRDCCTTIKTLSGIYAHIRMYKNHSVVSDCLWLHGL